MEIDLKNWELGIRVLNFIGKRRIFKWISKRNLKFIRQLRNNLFDKVK